MSDTTIRDAIAADLPAITAIYSREVETGSASFETTAPSVAEMTGRFESVVGHDLPWLVAGPEGAVVGYAYASPFRPRPAYRYAVETSVYVAPGGRGAGVGAALMAELIRRCEARGLRQMIAAIGDSGNTASIALHRRCGFRDVGIYRDAGFKFDRWIDVVLMQRSLGDGAATAPDGPGLAI